MPTNEATIEHIEVYVLYRAEKVGTLLVYTDFDLFDTGWEHMYLFPGETCHPPFGKSLSRVPTPV